MSWQDQGRQEHGWFGHGTTSKDGDPARTGGVQASNLSPPRYIASDPEGLLGHPSFGNGECVKLVQQAAGAPLTRDWRAGEFVESRPVPPGTAVATFDSNGRYGNHTDGTSHAAIVPEWTSRGFWGIEQFNIRGQDGRIIHSVGPKRHFFEFGHSTGSPITNGSNYRVIR